MVDTLSLTTDKSSAVVSADSQQMQILGALIHKGAHTLFYTIKTFFNLAIKISIEVRM